MLRSVVVDSIESFEKRVSRSSLEMDLDEENGAIEVTVKYVVNRTGNSDSFTFPWYLDSSSET